MLLGKIKSDYFKNKKGGGGGTRGFVPYFWTEQVLKFRKIFDQ